MRTLQLRLPDGLLARAQGLVRRGLYANTADVLRDSLRRLVAADELAFASARRFLIVFTADVHGNLEQYRAVFRKALALRADAVVFGGDLLPKDAERRSIAGQRAFIAKELIPLIEETRVTARRQSLDLQVFLIMGNDDFKANMDVLRRHQGAGYVLLDGRPRPLFEDFKIVGYPYVPFTPFRHKDWERPDTAHEDERVTRGNIVFEGVRSRGTSLVPTHIDVLRRARTIEHDLDAIARRCDPRKTVFVIHAPPHGGVLDVMHAGTNVGSRAVAGFIARHSPLLTLHGHVHETVQRSGSFLEERGGSVSIAAGNDNRSERPYVVVVDLFAPSRARRELA